ncbi:metallophosphoesterase family protein [Fontibacter flavus]|uniref:Metallophosphoesterase family protein n=1 Tax=Fontibacter flavus TaxID=654838 RepID=A0ABV6FW26_9BACT|nr:serine/threonine protein phosphatase [Cyclobacteriaceae bacterium]
MNLFVIGDVHGCFHTFLKLLERWDPKTEKLIQVGDLVDRGNFSPMALRLAFELQLAFKSQTVFLMGNHESMMIKFLQGLDFSNHWGMNGGNQTLLQFERDNKDPMDYLDWLKNMPLFWENKNVYISHAGLNTNARNPFDPQDKYSLLWNRQPLQNIGKLQIIGHTPQLDGNAKYHEHGNYWNIDTAAAGGMYLTGIKLKRDGALIEIISVPTDMRDLR